MLMKVLIVDDDPSMQMMAEIILTKAGFEVAAIEDGALALSGARAASPDVILLDCVMPGITGEEVFEMLAGEDVTKDIPIIFLTGKTEPEETRKLIALGARGVITKPISPLEFADDIRKILSS